MIWWAIPPVDLQAQVDGCPVACTLELEPSEVYPGFVYASAVDVTIEAHGAAFAGPIEVVGSGHLTVNDAVWPATVGEPLLSVEAGQVTLGNPDIHDVTAPTLAGAVLVATGGSVEVLGGSLSGITVSSGAMRVDGGALDLDGVTVDAVLASGDGGVIELVSGTVTVRDAQLLQNQGAAGGAIRQWGGTLLVERSVLTDNAAVVGGAAHITGGTATFVDSWFQLCTAARGGAVSPGASVGPAPTVTLTGCTFASNHASTRGGALDHAHGTLDVSGCAFVDDGTDGDGGSIWSSAELHVVDTSFADGGATTLGGAIAAIGPLTVSSSGFYRSVAAAGGAIALDHAGPVTIEGSTFCDTRAGSGGGLYVDGATPILHHLAFAGPRSSGGGAMTIVGASVRAEHVTVRGPVGPAGVAALFGADLTLTGSLLGDLDAAAFAADPYSALALDGVIVWPQPDDLGAPWVGAAVAPVTWLSGAVPSARPFDLACAIETRQHPTSAQIGAWQEPGGALVDYGAFGGAVPQAWALDDDGDGTGWLYDCDAADPAVHGFALERCDGADDDCDGFVDETTAWVHDADGDGFGADEPAQISCVPAGVRAVAADPARVDCDDTDPDVHPGAVDPPGDGRDQDCDGTDGTTPGDTSATGDTATPAIRVRAASGRCGCGGGAPGGGIVLVAVLAALRRRQGSGTSTGPLG
ncbi:MAG: putative metal-binding motif-containing protein [Myxococcota bacterium]